MKSKLYYLLTIVFLASCSSPKYAYNFDRYDYNSSKKMSPERDVAPLEAQQLLASKKSTFLVVDVPKDDNSTAATKPADVRKTYAQMSKTERKKFRTDVKKYLKKKKESIKAQDHSPQLVKNDSSKNGYAVAGFILSITSLFIFWPLSILGIIFSAIGLKSERKGLATAGLIIGIVAIFLVIVAGMVAAGA